MGFSEFGRRVTENSSAGTDHGTSGPVFLAVGVSLRRNLRGNLNFIGGVIGSVLYGDTEEMATGLQANGTSTNIIESRMGLEYFVPARGGFISLRGGWENHWYSGLSMYPGDEIDPEDLDVNLGGPVIAISFER